MQNAYTHEREGERELRSRTFPRRVSLCSDWLSGHSHTPPRLSPPLESSRQSKANKHTSIRRRRRRRRGRRGRRQLRRDVGGCTDVCTPLYSSQRNKRDGDDEAQDPAPSLLHHRPHPLVVSPLPVRAARSSCARAAAASLGSRRLSLRLLLFTSSRPRRTHWRGEPAFFNPGSVTLSLSLPLDSLPRFHRQNFQAAKPIAAEDDETRTRRSCILQAFLIAKNDNFYPGNRKVYQHFLLCFFFISFSLYFTEFLEDLLI